MRPPPLGRLNYLLDAMLKSKQAVRALEAVLENRRAAKVLASLLDEVGHAAVGGYLGKAR